MTAPTCHVAIILIRNLNGDWFVHQRAGTKARYPNLFGLGAGGSIEPNETPDQAARRELLEETGIEADPFPHFEFTYRSEKLVQRVVVFELLTSSDPGHDLSEWQWSGWLPESEVERLACEGRLCPDTLAVFERYLASRSNRAP